jgi:hypothetical protein
MNPAFGDGSGRLPGPVRPAGKLAGKALHGPEGLFSVRAAFNFALPLQHGFSFPTERTRGNVFGAGW